VVGSSFTNGKHGRLSRDMMYTILCLLPGPGVFTLRVGLFISPFMGEPEGIDGEGGLFS
jgi:hypothetical protein